MKLLDLFSGIAGFSLGLERAGFETIAFCEIEKYPRKKLKKHWPDVPIALDIRKLSYNRKTLQLFYKTKVIYVGTIQAICGGFPCQPYSLAGQRRGKEDNRHLWPEMFRLIKETRVNWVIGENVAGFITMALDDVLSDLEGEGYGTQSFVIPACAVGGVHRRDRVWIVANAERTTGRRRGNNIKCNRHRRQCTETKPESLQQENGQSHADNTQSSGSIVANADDERLQGKSSSENNGRVGPKSYDKQSTGRSGTFGFRPIEPPTQCPVRHRNDGLADNMARLKALGNAVVPQIPELIGRAIMAIEGY